VTLIEKFGTLTLERRGPVTELTLTRPELLNRFDDDLHVEFTAALRMVAGDAETRAVVLASTGKVFSAGGDFELMRTAHRDPAARRRIVDDGRALLTTLIDVPLPVVAAIQGAAVGLGATVALACDAVVAARSAWVADTHVNIGLVAGDGGCVVWPQSIGMLLAKRHLLTGERLDAERAYQLGVVSDLVDEPAEVLPAARALAERIAALPPLAVQGTKRSLNRVLQQRSGEVLDLSFTHESVTLASDDLLEAIAAFEERRPGKFEGR
jgi:enoyl-CoA hydratase